MANENRNSQNKRVDLPMLDIEKTGRIEFSIYKMTTGFIGVDDNKGSKHSMTSQSDIRETIELANESVIEKITKLLNDMTEGDFVNLTIIVEQRTEDFVPAGDFQYQEPDSLNVNQLTDMINDMINGGALTGIPGMSPFGKKVMITPQALGNYLSSQRAIKIRQAPNTGRGEPSSNTTRPGQDKGKGFYHDTKNRPPDQPKQPGQGGEAPKPTKID